MYYLPQQCDQIIVSFLASARKVFQDPGLRLLARKLLTDDHRRHCLPENLCSRSGRKINF